MRHFQIHDQKNCKAHQLGSGGGKSRAVDAHAQLHDQNVVPQNVQKTTGGQAEHGIKGLALIAQAVIENQGADDHWRGQKYPEAIVHGVGGDGVGAAEKMYQRLEKRKARHADYHPQTNAGEKGSGDVHGGLVGILVRQRPGNVGAGAMAEHEGQTLHDGLDGEEYARRGLSTFPQSADKVGVRHVIDAGDEHGNNGGDTEIQNQPGNRGFRHFLVMRLRTGQEIAFFLLFSIL